MAEWSERDDETVRDLWAKGYSASEISKQLDNRSRNSVIGRIWRLKLPKRITEKSSRDTAQRERRKNERATVAKNKTATFTLRRAERFKLPPQPIEPPTAVKIGKGILILDLKPHHCRDVIGYLGELGKPMYCGEPKYKNTSYCEYHNSINNIPPRSR